MAANIGKKTTAKERRQSPRYSALEKAQVGMSGDDLRLPYHLINISQGGMAFEYTNEKPLPLTHTRMDVYLNLDLHVGRLPIEVVADRLMTGGIFPERRCSVRFGKLTQTQKLQLETFIRLHKSVPKNS